MTQLELPGIANVICLRALHPKRKGFRASSARTHGVAIFPIPRRAGFIEDLAIRLDLADDAQRDTRWQNACIALAGELRRAGCRETDVAGHLYWLQAAVQRAMDRRAGAPRHQGDGDAA